MDLNSSSYLAMHNRRGPRFISTQSKSASKNFESGWLLCPVPLWPGPRPEAYLHTKWHLDSSNPLATIHQRHRQSGHTRQTRQTGQRSDSIGQTVFGRPFVKRFTLCHRTAVCPVCPAPPDPKGAQHPHFSAHVYCGQTVTHLCYCWALVKPSLIVD